MAKKKIDLWGDTHSYRKDEVVASSDTSLSIGKKSKKASGPIIGATSDEGLNATQEQRNLIREQRSIKNPLSVVEGKSEVVTDVSTAVSAALSKAIQDDYEIERLAEILDVVIDEVDDPDLSNESLRRKNFGIIPLFLLIGSIVLGIILLPLVLLLGYSINKVGDLTQARDIMGYKTDAEGPGQETHFSIKHVDSGKYLTPPVDETGSIIYNAPLTLTTTSPFDTDGDFINDLYFHVPASAQDEIQINYESYSIVNDGGDVKWMESFEAQSGIYLVKDTSKQEFSIGFENTNKFLAYDKKSDALELSNNPDYFKFEADVSFIEDADSYLSDYTFLNSGSGGYVSNLDLGINGNPLSLYSTKSHKHLSAYEFVDYKDLPFINISNYQYEDALTLTNEMNYDFFLNPVVTGSTSKLSLGSFQTTKFNWTQIPFGNSSGAYEMEPSAKTQFPLLTSDGDDVYFKQYTNSYQLGEKMGDGTTINEPVTEYPDTIIYLLPDPTNLKNKAIYFVEADAFLSTEGGIHLQQITSPAQISTLDFFQFDYSQNRNPEFVHSTVDSLTEDSGNFTLYSNNYSNLKGWELFLNGYSNEAIYNLKKELADIWTDSSLTIEEQQDAIVDAINGAQTTSKHAKSATGKNTEAFELTNLNYNTWYVGVANVYRDQHKNVGPHFTSIPVIFKTADMNGNVVNWGDGDVIEISEPSVGDPTENGTSSTPAVVTELIETTWIENPSSINNVSNGESDTDLLADDMRSMASTSLEVTTTLTNGKITNAKSGVVTGIRITLLDEDEDEVEQQEFTTEDIVWGLEDGDYTFLFKDLEPSKSYSATIEVQDIAGDWYVPQQTSDNSTEQEALELTTERLLPNEITSKVNTTYNSRGEANETAIPDLINIEAADTINFKFTSKTDGTRFETGFKPISSYESGVQAGGKLTIKLKELVVAGGYSLSIGGSPSIVGEEYTFEAILKTGPADFDGWEDESPLWYDGEQGQIKLFDGTVKQAA